MQRRAWLVAFGVLPLAVAACSSIVGIEEGMLDPASCKNGVKDNGETGVDCGGPCAACPAGSGATTASATSGASSAAATSSSTNATSGNATSGAGGASTSSSTDSASTSSSAGGATSSGAGGATSSSAGGAGGDIPDAGPDAPAYVCGDNIIDPGEECDDGNDTAGDGCTGCVVDCAGFKDPTSHHCYVETAASTTKKWSASRTACQKNGGELAAITSADELAFVAANVTAPVWIGGSDTDVDLVFVWSDGEPWSYASWLPGAPGAPNSGLNCVSLQGSPMGFQEIDCGTKQTYLCENSPIGN